MKPQRHCLVINAPAPRVGALRRALKLPAALALCLLYCAGAVSAQDAPADSAPPGITLLKLKWSRDARMPGSWDRSPFDASSGAGDPLATSPGRAISAPSIHFPSGNRLTYIYTYSAKIRNDGARRIKGVFWEYVLSDPGSRRELGRHRFLSYRKIDAHKTATLRGQSRSAPALVVSAGGLEKDKRSPFDERFEIRCVMYADGSWWKHPSAKEAECQQLKNREKMRRTMNR